MQDWRIRAEAEADTGAIEALVALSFGAGRFAKTAWRLREGVDPVVQLSFVAVAGDGGLIGSVRFWPVMIGGHLSLLLGPLAVRPGLRGQGVGIQLMQTALDAARTLAFESVILVGDEPYYAKVGFARIPPGRIRFPGPVDPGRLLGLSLKQGALLTVTGEVRRAGIDHPVSAQAAALG